MTVHAVHDSEPLIQKFQLNDSVFEFELDSGARDNFCHVNIWKRLGSPLLQRPETVYKSATGDEIPVQGIFMTEASIIGTCLSKRITFNVTSIQNLNLIGRRAMVSLNIDLNALLQTQSISSISVPPFQLRKKCELLCEEFNELFSPEVGCLKDFELEIRFKPDSRPIFVKPRTVPLAIQEELNGALEAGIRKGIWMPCEFNDYGIPVVPIRKRGK